MIRKKNLSKTIILLIFIAISCISCLEKSTKTQIKFSTWGSEMEMKIIKPIIQDFEVKNPEIEVEIIHIPQNYFQKLHMLVAANLTPDVIFINNLHLPIYASGNILLDLTPYWKNSKTLQQETFFKNAMKTMNFKGHLLAIPRDISNLVVYYNKDLFKKYNVKIPDNNWTMANFLHSSQKLTQDTDKNNKIDQWGVSFGKLPLYYMPFVWSNNGRLFTKNKKRFALCNQSACEAIQFYADLRNKYKVAPSDAEAGNNTMAQLFTQGKIAMYLSGRWSVPKFREDLNFEWDIAPFPKGKKGSIVSIDGSGWAIAKKSQNIPEAWKLVEYLASKQSLEKVTTTGLIIPSNKNIAYSSIFIDNKPPKNAQIFIETIENGIPTPQITRWNEVVDKINETLEPVWNGKHKACTNLNSIRNEINELLD